MTQNDSPQSVRLNKFIAQHLAIGRRQADTLITQGKVLINGQKPILGARVSPEDKITVDGINIKPSQNPKFTYLLFNKPEGYVCSRRQQGAAQTIYARLPQVYQHLKPVGRLDKDSSGLLLLTNDGDFAHKLTHPSFQKEKQYEVLLDKSLRAEHQQQINQGVELADGISKLNLQRQNTNRNWLVTMHEGRNRQIRRTFSVLGYTVKQLHRIKFGNFALDNLAPGKFREIEVSNSSEVN